MASNGTDLLISEISNDCNDTEATNALAFMLVGINTFFKIVIAYYFITVLTGKEKSHILHDILHVTHENGISICNVTFDGASTNVSMVQELGAKITTHNKLKTYFEHLITQEPVTVMLDACHMLNQKHICCERKFHRHKRPCNQMALFKIYLYKYKK